GMLTFPFALLLFQVARFVPVVRFFFELDSPYLAPVPFRGRRNEPAFVVETAKLLAEVKQVSLDTVARCTTENYQRLFHPARETSQ
ncbi:MAG: TatD family hydrolase, partial [Acidobacteria bacterium]|nr:TatD family hydrolase [Acidobacteriota bacterium]